MAVRLIREEATMAAMTFDTAYQQRHVRAQLDAILATFREMLDAFVSNRMQRAAAEAKYARPRQFPNRPAQPTSAQ
jgi:hypothetical protein